MDSANEMLLSIPSQVYYATGGGLAIKLLELAELRNIPKVRRPDLREWLYWVNFSVLPLLGGALAFIYYSSDMVLKPIIAANVGISAPLIFRAMAGSIPKQIEVGNAA